MAYPKYVLIHVLFFSLMEINLANNIRKFLYYNISDNLKMLNFEILGFRISILLKYVTNVFLFLS